MRIENSQILVIIPAFNEEDNIVSTIEDLRAHVPDVDFVVVSDGSTDRTPLICDERRYPCIKLPVNLGLAGAFQAGMKHALRNGYRCAIQFDADGQHSAAYIPALVRAAEDQGANVVIGSRFCDGRHKEMSARMAGSTLITGLIRLTARACIKDPTSGMRLFDASVMPYFANEANFGPEPDTLALLIRGGAKVVEVPVRMRERTAGQSYFNLTKSMSYMLRMGVSIAVVQWFRRKQ